MEAMVKIFEHLGGVPPEIWFDNATTMVTKVIYGGGRQITERFARFAQHYRFKPVFMNPASGWEKGNVENKVGYIRNNLLVPTPRFKTLNEFNTKAFQMCEKDMRREHYKNFDGKSISELFQENKSHLLELPSVPFDTALYTTVMTDKYGKFQYGETHNIYSVSPDYAHTVVNLRITSKTISVLDKDLKEILKHRRLYEEKAESMDWIPYLSTIARKPRSLRNSGLYDMMPPAMQQFMDRCSNTDRGKTLKSLAELLQRGSFTEALRTVEKAIELNATDPDSLLNLHRRLFSDIPELPPLDLDENIPKTNVVPFRNDLKQLDDLLHQKGDAVNE